MRYLALTMFALLASAGAIAQPPAAIPPVGAASAMHPVQMAVTSSAFESGGVLPDQFTMANGPTAGSPPLAWSGAPAGTVSFVLHMHDVDVVVGKGTGDNLHWLAFNIPATVTSLPAGVPKEAQLPDGTVQLVNPRGIGFGPPGAPPGVYHHYLFEVWALDSKLPLGPGATRTEVLKAMDGHVLDKGTLVARFHR